MRRKTTRQSRGPNATEKARMAWLKDRQICAACGNHGPVINHHAEGSCCKIKLDLVTVHIGHAFVLGLCQTCDNLVTRGSRRALTDAFGPQSEMWLRQERDNPAPAPAEIVEAIRKWGK